MPAPTVTCWMSKPNKFYGSCSQVATSCLRLPLLLSVLCITQEYCCQQATLQAQSTVVLTRCSLLHICSFCITQYCIVKAWLARDEILSLPSCCKLRIIPNEVLRLLTCMFAGLRVTCRRVFVAAACTLQVRPWASCRCAQYAHTSRSCCTVHSACKLGRSHGHCT